MKGSTEFEKTISTHLEKVGASDPAFAEKLKNPKKNIKDCITYIMNQVKASGCNGFADEEIYGMAMHYYDEEDVKVGGKISGTVVVNHKVELSEEEKEAARLKAIDDLKAEEKKKLAAEIKIDLTPEEIEEARELARQEALAKAAAEQKEKLTKKAEKKKAVPAPEVQSGLFD